MDSFLQRLADAFQETVLERSESSLKTRVHELKEGVFLFQRLTYRINCSVDLKAWLRQVDIGKLYYEHGYSELTLEIPEKLSLSRLMELSAELNLSVFKTRMLLILVGNLDLRKLTPEPCMTQVKHYLTLKTLENVTGLLKRMTLLLSQSGKQALFVRKYQQALQRSDLLAAEQDACIERWIYCMKLYEALLLDKLIDDQTALVWFFKTFEAASFEQTLFLLPVCFCSLSLFYSYESMWTFITLVTRKLPYLTHVKAKTSPLVALLHTNLVVLVQSLVLSHPEAFVSNEADRVVLDAFFRQSHLSLAFSLLSLSSKVFLAMSYITNLPTLSPTSGHGAPLTTATSGSPSDSPLPHALPMLEHFRKDCATIETHLKLRCALHKRFWHSHWIEASYILSDELLCSCLLKQRCDRLLTSVLYSGGSILQFAPHYFKVAATFSRALSLARILELQLQCLMSTVLYTLNSFGLAAHVAILVMHHAVEHGVTDLSGNTLGIPSHATSLRKQRRHQKTATGPMPFLHGETYQVSSFIEGYAQRPNYLGFTPGSQQDSPPATMHEARVAEFSYYFFKSTEFLVAKSSSHHCDGKNCELSSGKLAISCTHKLIRRLYTFARMLAREKLIVLDHFPRYGVEFGYLRKLESKLEVVGDVDPQPIQYVLSAGTWSRFDIKDIVQPFLVKISNEISVKVCSVPALSENPPITREEALSVIANILKVDIQHDSYPFFKPLDNPRDDWRLLLQLSWADLEFVNVALTTLCCRRLEVDGEKLRFDVDMLDFVAAFLDVQSEYGYMFELLLAVLKYSKDCSLCALALRLIQRHWCVSNLYKVNSVIWKSDSITAEGLVERHFKCPEICGLYGNAESQDLRHQVSVQLEILALIYNKLTFAREALLPSEEWFLVWILETFEGIREIPYIFACLSESGTVTIKRQPHVLDSCVDAKQMVRLIKDKLVSTLKHKVQKEYLKQFIGGMCTTVDEISMSAKFTEFLIKERTGVYELDSLWEADLLEHLLYEFFSLKDLGRLKAVINQLLLRQVVYLEVFVFNFVMAAFKLVCDNIAHCRDNEANESVDGVCNGTLSDSLQQLEVLIDILYMTFSPRPLRRLSACEIMHNDAIFALFIDATCTRPVHAVLLHVRSLLVCFSSQQPIAQKLEQFELQCMSLFCMSVENFWEMPKLSVDDFALPLLVGIREGSEIPVIKGIYGVSLLVRSMTERQLIEFLIDATAAQAGETRDFVRNAIFPNDIPVRDRHCFATIGLANAVVMLKSLLMSKAELECWLEAVWCSTHFSSCIDPFATHVVQSYIIDRLSNRVSVLGPFLLKKWGELITPLLDVPIEVQLQLVNLPVAESSAPSSIKPLYNLSLSVALSFGQTPNQPQSLKEPVELLLQAHEQFFSWLGARDDEFVLSLALENIFGHAVPVSSLLTKLKLRYLKESGSSVCDLVPVRKWLFYKVTCHTDSEFQQLIQSIKSSLKTGVPLVSYIEALLAHVHLMQSIVPVVLRFENFEPALLLIKSLVGVLLNSTLVYHHLCAIHVSSVGMTELFSISAIVPEPFQGEPSTSESSSSTTPKGSEPVGDSNSPPQESYGTGLDDAEHHLKYPFGCAALKMYCQPVFGQRHSLMSSSMLKASLKLPLYQMLGDWLLLLWRTLCQKEKADSVQTEVLKFVLEQLERKAQVLNLRLNKFGKPCLEFFVRIFGYSCSDKIVSALSPAHASFFKTPTDEFLSVQCANELRPYISQIGNPSDESVPFVSATEEASYLPTRERHSGLNALKVRISDLLQSHLTSTAPARTYHHSENLPSYNTCEAAIPTSAHHWLSSYELTQPTCEFIESSLLQETRNLLQQQGRYTLSNRSQLY